MRWAIPLVALMLAVPAAGQGVPACGPSRDGQLACVANRLCVCRFERGGSLAARPDRWDWDCSILRPDCTVAPAGEAAPAPVMPGIVVMPQVMGPGGGRVR